MAKTRKKKSKYNVFILLSITSILFLIISFIFAKSNLISLPCANSQSCTENLSGDYDKNATEGNFQGDIAQVPKETKDENFTKNVLAVTSEEKRIEINLATQHLYAYEGDRVVYDFLISTGKWNETPTGTFYIWIKLRYTRMVGGDKDIGTYYNLPNVPYTMYFYNDQVPKYLGYGIHGAYWHNNFGHPMSHGCINMRTEDVEKLYDWADPATSGSTTYANRQNPGTKVVIYGVTPAS